MKIALLLTACVTPNTQQFISVTDTQTRYQQYIRALTWYFDHTHFDIILAENSGFDFHLPLKISQSKRFEMISWKEELNKIDHGKGYKEALMLNKVSQNSNIFQRNDVIIKITGRLIVKNIIEICRHLPPSFNQQSLCCHFLSGTWRIDTRCFIAGQKAYCDLLKFRDRIDEFNEPHLIMESAYSLALCDGLLRQTLQFYYPFDVFRYEGQGGGSGDLYTVSASRHLMKQLFHRLKYPIIRHIAPNRIIRHYHSWLQTILAV